MSQAFPGCPIFGNQLVDLLSCFVFVSEKNFFGDQFM